MDISKYHLVKVAVARAPANLPTTPGHTACVLERRYDPDLDGHRDAALLDVSLFFYELTNLYDRTRYHIRANMRPYTDNGCGNVSIYDSEDRLIVTVIIHLKKGGTADDTKSDRVLETKRD